MANDVENELNQALARVLESPSQKKLIVSGPGTGKTYLFRRILESTSGGRESRLVLTFINNLKADLEKDLSDISSVFTLHGFCQSLLRRRPDLRGGLTRNFRCVPGLASLIKDDWEYVHEGEAPRFVDRMRTLSGGEELGFYLERADYYDAVDFDDSVYRVYEQLSANGGIGETYDLILVDEYQDFNRMEAALIEALAAHSPIVIAGDDDQALYSQLRGASWDHIRGLYQGGEYEIFELPFCMRCPEVIVEAVNDIVHQARSLRRLQGRIDKPFRHYAPVNSSVSARYPRIDVVMSTVQRNNANYFGRYIERAINTIPDVEFDEARTKGEPAVLIIGSRQYLRQIGDYLTERDYRVETKRVAPTRLEKEQGLEILNESPESNIGWRIVTEFEEAISTEQIVRESTSSDHRLVELIPQEVKERVLSEARALAATDEAESEESGSDAGNSEESLSIKLTSFEGAKGLSAQHVFIVGMHENEFPRDARAVKDIEICRFVVGLTRTRKKCTLMWTRRFANKPKRQSPFLRWIRPIRYEQIRVDANYWRSLNE